MLVTLMSLRVPLAAAVLLGLAPASRQIHTATKVERAMMLFISEFLHWSVEPKVCLSKVDVRRGLMRLKWSYKIMRGSPE